MGIQIEPSAPHGQARILEIVARVTRYPRELLALDADLEDELGIDSVKLQEIVAAIEQAFPGLPPLPDRERPRTLGAIAAWVQTSGASQVQHASKRTADAPTAAGLQQAPDREGSNPRAFSVDRSLEGKIVFISGSGHGLGRTTALELAQRGAHVIVNSFHHRERGEAVAQEILRQGGKAHHIWASMARADQVERLFDDIGQQFGGLDIFIHNASNGVFAKLADVSEEQWLKSFRTNVMGFHRGALRAAALMRSRGGGKMLTLSSVYEDATMEYFGVQGPVKAGLESLTRFFAKEFLHDNIQVNCISFGAIDGETMSQYPESPRLRAATEARSQGQRWMTELEAARVQLLFLSPAADSITGSIIRADRGMMLSV